MGSKRVTTLVREHECGKISSLELMKALMKIPHNGNYGEITQRLALAEIKSRCKVIFHNHTVCTQCHGENRQTIMQSNIRTSYPLYEDSDYYFTMYAFHTDELPMNQPWLTLDNLFTETHNHLWCLPKGNDLAKEFEIGR